MTAGGCPACSSVGPGWRIRAGSVGSGRAVGAETNKSQAPAEQGHQIKVCSRDLFALRLEE